MVQVSVLVGWVSVALSHLTTTARLLIPIFALLLALELAFSKVRHSARSRLRACGFWAVYLLAMAVAMTLADEIWSALNPRPFVVLRVDRWFAGVPYFGGVLAVLTGATIGDFFFYWMHRAEHRWLWRFHAVHHSIEEMNAISSYHHVFEEVVKLVFLYIPTAFFVTDAENLSLILGVLVTLQGFYLHSSTKLHLGPLRYIIGDNLFHRIHHSIEPRHFGRNFSAFSPLWDIAFGTAYFPARTEWPATGLVDVREPASLGEYLARPFDRAKPAVIPADP